MIKTQAEKGNYKWYLTIRWIMSATGLFYLLSHNFYWMKIINGSWYEIYSDVMFPLNCTRVMLSLRFSVKICMEKRWFKAWCGWQYWCVQQTRFVQYTCTQLGLCAHARTKIYGKLQGPKICCTRMKRPLHWFHHLLSGGGQIHQRSWIEIGGVSPHKFLCSYCCLVGT